MSDGQADLASLDIPGVATFVEQRRQKLAPVNTQRDAGVPIAVIQPHSDDAALSAAGLLHRWTGRVDIVTVFSDKHRDQHRRTEDSRFAALFNCGLTFLYEQESCRMLATEPANLGAAAITHVATLARESEIVGPLGVGSHPDHLAIARLAQQFDCRVYWEDVAFWGIYSASVEDRFHFTAIDPRPNDLVAVVTEIAIDAKIAALDCYRSQSLDAWRPIRYAAVVAREHGMDGFCERLFVRRNHLDWFADAINTILKPLNPLTYGQSRFPAYAAPLGPK